MKARTRYAPGGRWRSANSPSPSETAPYSTESGARTAATHAPAAGLPVSRSVTNPATAVCGIAGPVEKTTSSGSVIALPKRSCTTGWTTTW